MYKYMLVVLATFQWGAGAPEASFFDELGRRAYQQGDFDQAFENFTLVHKIAPSPRNLFNLALSAELGGRPRIAFTFWEAYLRGGDEDPDRSQRARRRHRRLARRLAILRVESDPPGAEIFVDRRDLGSFGTTPRTLVVEPGEHRLILEHGTTLPGFADVEAKLGDTESVSLRLQPRRGVLQVVGSPPHAEVIVFDKESNEVARRKLGESITLPVGPYRVRLVAESYYDEEAEVVVGESYQDVRRMVAEPKPDIAGRLLVTAGSHRAELYINGEPRGTTPAVLERVAPGEYTIELRAPGRTPWIRRQRVEAGKSLLVRARLERRKR